LFDCLFVCLFALFPDSQGYLLNMSRSNTSSSLYKMLSGKSAAAGHSEGGAASFISGAPGTTIY
jgi:hypothetical protein